MHSTLPQRRNSSTLYVYSLLLLIFTTINILILLLCFTYQQLGTRYIFLSDWYVLRKNVRLILNSTAVIIPPPFKSISRFAAMARNSNIRTEISRALLLLRKSITRSCARRLGRRAAPKIKLLWSCATRAHGVRGFPDNYDVGHVKYCPLSQDPRRPLIARPPGALEEPCRFAVQWRLFAGCGWFSVSPPVCSSKSAT